MVLDADALNIISTDKKLFKLIPAQTILTPHLKEFDRLFGIHSSMIERIKTATLISKKSKIIIVLKGYRTVITYNGVVFENSTGNAGLAKAGSGDALTGIITAMLAQGYSPINSAKASVYLHGLAADICLQNQTMESMIITDVINCLGKAFGETIM